MTQAFNLSQFANSVNTSGQASLTTGVIGTLPVANGGTNNGSLAVTAGGVVYTDGSKLVNVGAGTTGQVLTSAGASASTWASAAVGGIGGTTAYTTSGSFTFTIPTGKTVIKAYVTGGGGAGQGANPAQGTGGAAGGTAIKYFTSVTSGNTITVTVGAGGGGRYLGTGLSGGTSSISSGTQIISTVSATGGAGSGGPGTGGVGSGGDLNLQGGDGGASLYTPSGQAMLPGGVSFWGGAVAGNTGGFGTVAATTGSGSGASKYTAASGGVGLVVFEY